MIYNHIQVIKNNNIIQQINVTIFKIRSIFFKGRNKSRKANAPHYLNATLHGDPVLLNDREGGKEEGEGDIKC